MFTVIYWGEQIIFSPGWGGCVRGSCPPCPPGTFAYVRSHIRVESEVVLRPVKRDATDLLETRSFPAAVGRQPTWVHPARVLALWVWRGLLHKP